MRRLGAGGAPNVRRTCSSVEAISSCVCSRLASPCSERRGGGAVEPGPALERVAQPWRVLGDVGVMSREQRDGAAHELGDDAPDVGVGDVLAAPERAEPDRAVRLGPVEPARHAIRDARTGSYEAEAAVPASAAQRAGSDEKRKRRRPMPSTSA